jgi:hypothetical protein
MIATRVNPTTLFRIVIPTELQREDSGLPAVVTAVVALYEVRPFISH